MAALGTAAPVGSATVPVMELRNDWAHSAAASKLMHETNLINLNGGTSDLEIAAARVLCASAVAARVRGHLESGGAKVLY